MYKIPLFLCKLLEVAGKSGFLLTEICFPVTIPLKVNKELIKSG